MQEFTFFSKNGSVCDSSLRAKSITFVHIITEIRLRSQFVTSKIMIVVWQTTTIIKRKMK